MASERNPHFRSHTGSHYWGLPGLSSTDGADGWYVGGTFSGGSQTNWQDVPISQGKSIERLTDTVRSAKQVSVAFVRNGEIVAHRTVYGPIPDLDILRRLIEREIMVHSPVG